jgi:hypothetical protein
VNGATNLVTVTATTGTVTLTLGSIITPRTAGSDVMINYSGNCDFILNGTTINANQISSGTGAQVTISKTSAGTLTINSNLAGSAGGSGDSNKNTLNSTAGNTVINGNITGGISAASANFSYTINQSAGNLTINGNITGGGVLSSGNSGLISILFSGQTLTVSGTITGGGAAIAVSTAATNINVSGSVLGGSGAVGLACSSAATINIIGPITPSSAASAVSLSGASTLTYSGSLASSANQPAIISSNASATNIFTGPFINTNNTMAVQCANMKLTADANTYWDYNDITLFSPEQLAFYPSASDIRQGTTYADGTVSGSLAMPPATAVIAGTPTDNTTGSAVLTPAQLQDAVWGRDLSQMTETGSIGNRLARVSTTGTTGAQIASYLL